MELSEAQIYDLYGSKYRQDSGLASLRSQFAQHLIEDHRLTRTEVRKRMGITPRELKELLEAEFI